MRISQEAIYQAHYIQGRGALKRELASYLRTGSALLRIPVNVTADSGNVTGIPANVTEGRCCAF